MNFLDLKLKACAHCGSEPTFIDTEKGCYVECTNFDCQIKVGASDWTQEAAVRIWNKRTDKEQ